MARTWLRSGSQSARLAHGALCVKATGVALAKVAARCMAGKTLAEQGMGEEIVPPYYSVKEAVFPFNKFPGVDPLLGPEMKSTGEVMGVGTTFGEAFIKKPACRRHPAAHRRHRVPVRAATPTRSR